MSSENYCIIRLMDIYYIIKLLTPLSLVLLWGNDIINLEDHLHYLSSQLQLLLLWHHWLEHTLLGHEAWTCVHCVNTNVWRVFFNLHFLNLLDVFNWWVSRVLSQSHRNLFKGISKSSDSVLLNTFNLVSFLLNLDGTSKLWGTTSTDDIVILDHVSNDTDCIEKTSLGLITDGFWSTSDQNGNSLWFWAILDQ